MLKLQQKRANHQVMRNEDIHYLIMCLTEGFYGERGSIFDIHPQGYSELCDQFSERFDSAWFAETFGIIPGEEIVVIQVGQHSELICKINDDAFGLISYDFWGSDENFQEAITDSYAYRLGFQNGIAEFDGVIDIEKLRLMLIEEPLILFKPFCHWGYFEKPSTIGQSMDNLKKAMNTFNSKN